MNDRKKLPSLLLQSLYAGEIAGIIISLLFSSRLFSLYHGHFTALSLPRLFLYFLGTLALSTVLLSLLFAALTTLFRNLLHRIFKKIGFGYFLAFAFSVHFIFWTALYVNARLLRYSRELKSYAADLIVVLLGALIFYLLYKVIPPLKSWERRRFIRVPALLLPLLFFMCLFLKNPFSIDRFIAPTNPPPTRNYDSQGHPSSPSVTYSPSNLNVVMLSIDTLRADGLGCYGNPLNTSPHIDALSREGVLFSNALSQSSWTLPSHMTMLTSLYPSVHGCVRSPMWSKFIDKLDDYWITLPEVLKSHGYRTAAFTDGALLGPDFNFDQGFDLCDDSGGGIEKIASKAIQWLKRPPSQEPFFLFLHCYDVHHYRPPEDIEKQFAKPYSGKLKPFRDSGHLLEERITSNAFYDLSPDDIDYLKALYHAEIHLTDRAFNRILTALKDLRLYDNTIIIVTSDHGEEFWEHGGTGHGWSLHQHQLKVPLIIKSPTLPQTGTKINSWVGLIDIAPTILDMLAIPVPSDFQGLSLVPLVTTQSTDKRLFLAEASHLGHQKGIIYEGHSFLYNKFPPIGERLFHLHSFIHTWRSIINSTGSALYNLGEDSAETQNIIMADPTSAQQMMNIFLHEWKRHLTKSLEAQNAPGGKLSQQAEENLRALGYIK